MKLGVLTAGGDCPGLNAVIRAVVRTANETYGSSVLGFREGWKGLVHDNRVPLLDDGNVNKMLFQGGTILGTGRLNPETLRNSLEKILDNLRNNRVDALIPIGGEGTLTAAQWLAENGVPIVGVPKTIDNDVNGTDQTFGFDTAVSIATDAIDRLHTTAESHKRIMIVEVMGRDVGWIALESGMAGGAHITIIPEHPFDVDDISELIQRRFDTGSTYTICVIAEGAKPKPGTMDFKEGGVDQYGHTLYTGIGQQLGNELQSRLKREVRTTVLGHIQRGGTPTAFDRILATRFGIHAVQAVHEQDFGKIVAKVGSEITRIPIADAIGTLKKVPENRYQESKILFG